MLFNIIQHVVYYIICHSARSSSLFLYAQGADPFEHHHLYTEHAAPFIRLRHHHGIFKF